jgi:hypothetical protein
MAGNQPRGKCDRWQPRPAQALGLGAAAYLAAIPRPSAKVPSNPDAALIDLCRLFDDDTRALQRFDALAKLSGSDDDEDALNDLLDQWHDTLDQIIAMPAAMGAGIRAKATALGNALMQCAFIDTNVSVDEQGENYARLAMSLVRDLAAVPG